ncbi:MAG: hypothetical protein PHE84_06480 [bacterium]|nr:hypothetical protein [bacterium]
MVSADLLPKGLFSLQLEIFKTSAGYCIDSDQPSGKNHSMQNKAAARAKQKDQAKIISYRSDYVRWHILAFAYGLIFSCLITFIEQSFFPYLPSNITLGVLSVIVFKPLIFIVFARVVARKKLPTA